MLRRGSEQACDPFINFTQHFTHYSALLLNFYSPCQDSMGASHSNIVYLLTLLTLLKGVIV